MKKFKQIFIDSFCLLKLLYPSNTTTQKSCSTWCYFNLYYYTTSYPFMSWYPSRPLGRTFNNSLRGIPFCCRKSVETPCMRKAVSEILKSLLLT